MSLFDQPGSIQNSSRISPRTNQQFPQNDFNNSSNGNITSSRVAANPNRQRQIENPNDEDQGQARAGADPKNSKQVQVQGGPRLNRILRQEQSGSKKTDQIWATTFYLTIGITILLSLVMCVMGQPDLLSHPQDPDGRPCGMGDVADFPYIYFVSPSKEYLYRSVCVKECPHPVNQPSLKSKLECAPNSVVDSCNFKISHSPDRSKEVLIYDTNIYLNKVCMPRNVSYFTLISNALHIDKLQESLSDLRKAAWLVVMFAVIAAILSYITKFMIDSESTLPTSMTIFFVVSTIGFFILGLVFALRFYLLLNTPAPNKKKVIEDDSVLQDNVTSNNASPTFNLTIAVVCFVSCWIYVRNAFEASSKNKKNANILDNLRDQMLLFVSDIIKKQTMMQIPFYTTLVYFFLLMSFFIVETNAFAVGTQIQDKKALPFDRFETSPIARVLNVVIVVGFFWAFIFVVQAAQYISLKQSIRHIDDFLFQAREPSNPSRSQVNSSNQNNPQNFLLADLKELLTYKVGTIAKCSIYTFFFNYPRQFFEGVDTSYQRKLGEIIEQTGKPKESEVPHTFYMKIQRGISAFYKSTFLKKIQPYGFLFTMADQLYFMEAGELMQNKIDDTSYWFEDILDRGELFESQIKYSICFVTSLGFYIIYLTLASASAQVIAPTLLSVVTSFFISEVYVNTYGQVFCSFILYYLVSSYQGTAKTSSQNNEMELGYFADFINRITSSSNADNQGKQQVQIYKNTL